MPSIEFIPIANGMTPQEIIARLDGGWIHIGDIAVRQEAKIVDPTKPMMPNGLIPCHVWVQQEPLVSFTDLAQLLYDLGTDEKLDKPTLDLVCQRIMGVPIEALVQQMQASAAEGEEGS